jgi:ubiquinol-cytochrome c reductase cytochrome b subunit
MAKQSYETTAGGGLWGWINARFPLDKMLKQHVTEYYAPKNINAWYLFGSLSLVVLALQLVTGLYLTMSYKPTATEAFASVEYIMRDVEWGWLIRYLHSTGASAFFIVVYLHMFRGLLYGSYRAPRELLWIFGMLIYLALMAEAFFGYLLPWGNLSYWGAQVIVSLFGTVPVIGDALSEWIKGDYFISDITLNRFFALHVMAIPLIMVFLVVAHILALHEVGSGNPDGIEIKEHKDANGIPLDGMKFHPYCTVEDILALGVFLLLFCGVVFFAPALGGLFLETPNFEIANPMQTPPHIAPVWYFTPFYAMLRSVPAYFGTQVWGVLVMFGGVLVLFFLPWLDRAPVKSIRYKGWIAKTALALFAVSFVVLAYCGMRPPAGIFPVLSRIFTAVYFAFFLLMPWWSRMGSFKPVPDRVTYHAH